MSIKNKISLSADDNLSKGRHRNFDAFKIALLSFTIHLILMIFIGINQPEYLLDYRRNANPDAHHYVSLGENFWLKGKYSREETPPYRPDILRTPVYPLLAGGLNVLSRVILPLYVLQAMCAIATSLIVYAMTVQLFGRRVALMAGFLYASDLMLAILNFQAMSEGLAVFLSTVSICLWLSTIWKSGETLSPLSMHALIGLFLGLSILTRPSALYLPLLLAIIEIILFLFLRKRIVLVAPLMLVMVSYLLIAPWIARNHALYGVPRLTTADTINLVYFASAGIYQLRFGITGEEAQAKIAADYSLTSLVQTNNFWLADEDIATMDSKQRRAAWDILTAHPFLLLESTGIGIAKAAISHNTADLAQAAGMTWNPPGMVNLLHGNVFGFFRQLFDNHWFLVFVFFWQMLLALASLVLGFIGLTTILMKRSYRLLAFSLLAVIGYYTAMIGVVGIDAYSRHRAMIIPIAVIFVAMGIDKVQTYFRVLSLDFAGSLSR